MWVNSIAVVCFYFVYAQHADVSVFVCVLFGIFSEQFNEAIAN